MIYQGSQLNFCIPSYFSVQSVTGKTNKQNPNQNQNQPTNQQPTRISPQIAISSYVVDEVQS